jgi:hypothetical protein
MPRKPKSDAAPSRATVRKQNLAALADAYAGDDYVSGKVRQGLDLEKSKVELFERIAVNRRQLRDFAVAGDIAPDDVELLYPTKGKGGDENGEDSA